MPKQPKPYSVLTTEKKSHMTKKQLENRKTEEDKLSSKKSMKIWPTTKKNITAAKEFKRVKELLKGIEKDDALYEAVINRYCIIKAEVESLESRSEELYSLVEKLEKRFDEASGEVSASECMEMTMDFSKEITRLLSCIANLDKDIQTKRKMLLDIEKENVMTVAAALRTIPKKEEKADPLLQILKGS